MNFRTNWEDLESNSILELQKMMMELEIPIIINASKKELIPIIENKLKPNSISNEKIKTIYISHTKTSKSKIPLYLIRIIIISILILFFNILIKRINRPKPFCNNYLYSNNCLECPKGAICKKGKAKCEITEYLTSFGCKLRNKRRIYKNLIRASNYISKRAGDCIFNYPPLTLKQFEKLFPTITLNQFNEELDFNIYFDNNSIYTLKPSIHSICFILEYLNKNYFFIGTIIFLILIIFIYKFNKNLNNFKIEKARELAKNAHKILSTTDKQIYMYDMKVQLRSQYQKIDEIWKYCVKAIEDNSHVLVGVVGVRHEVYWKWIHN